MNADLKNIPVTLTFDFNQFLLFFDQLPVEYKKLVVAILEKQLAGQKQNPVPWQSLRGTVLQYDKPFEPAVDWKEWGPGNDCFGHTHSVVVDE